MMATTHCEYLPIAYTKSRHQYKRNEGNLCGHPHHNDYILLRGYSCITQQLEPQEQPPQQQVPQEQLEPQEQPPQS